MERYTADRIRLLPHRIDGLGSGWVGGSGTAWRTGAGRGLTGILPTQRMLTSPGPVELVKDFRAAAYAAIDTVGA